MAFGKATPVVWRALPPRRKEIGEFPIPGRSVSRGRIQAFAVLVHPRGPLC
jgi:hypothetical protein